jgi:hypothetical protein
VKSKNPLTTKEHKVKQGVKVLKCTPNWDDWDRMG